jgi:hypothetical protein
MSPDGAEVGQLGQFKKLSELSEVSFADDTATPNSQVVKLEIAMACGFTKGFFLL